MGKRRKFSAEFKARVAQEALEGRALHTLLLVLRCGPELSPLHGRQNATVENEVGQKVGVDPETFRVAVDLAGEQGVLAGEPGGDV